jgi:hypothetical protein
MDWSQLTWWQYSLIAYGIILVVSVIIGAIELRRAIEVPQDIDIYDL